MMRRVLWIGALAMLALPMTGLADVTGTPALTAGTMLNLDTGATGATGGDFLWTGTTITPQSGAGWFSLGSGPGTSGYSNAPAFSSGTTYTFELSVARYAGETRITGRITGEGLTNLSVMKVDTTGSNYHRFDTFMVRNATATNSADVMECKEFKVEVLAAPPVAAHIVTQPTNQVVFTNQSATFVVGAAGSEPLTYQWRHNGTNMASATASSCTVTNVQLADAGFYTVIVSNNAGSVTSHEAQLIIAATPVAQGNGTGLRGLYYDNSDFTSLKVSRLDANVDFDWGTGSPDASIGADQFSVRWLGQVEPRYSQTYTFHTSTDDGVRLWVNGVLLIDHWNDQSTTEWSGTVALNAGQKYDLRMDYYENTGSASAQLRWSSASQLKEVIPQRQLYRPPPVLAPIADKSVLEGTTLTFGAPLTDCDQVAAVTPLEDFESFPDGSASGQVMFRKPGFSGTTSASCTRVDFPGRHNQPLGEIDHLECAVRSQPAHRRHPVGLVRHLLGQSFVRRNGCAGNQLDRPHRRERWHNRDHRICRRHQQDWRFAQSGPDRKLRRLDHNQIQSPPGTADCVHRKWRA